MKPVILHISVEGQVESFLYKLTELHEERNRDEIWKFLGINRSNSNEQNNGSYLEYVSVKTNNHIKKTIDVVRYIISRKDFTLWIENILTEWNDKLNKKRPSEINTLIQKSNFDGDYDLNRIISFTVNGNLWDAFKLRCFRSNLTVADGFKYAVVNYITNY